jgi:hypothetical protein
MNFFAIAAGYPRTALPGFVGAVPTAAQAAVAPVGKEVGSEHREARRRIDVVRIADAHRCVVATQYLDAAWMVRREAHIERSTMIRT